MQSKNNLLSFLVCSCLILINACQQKQDDDSLYSGQAFNESIRPTDARTPEEEWMGFKLPPGFEIQLFASEPDIQKPMNMQFDAKGRMWLTQSFDYPFPAAPGNKGKDRLTILEDTDHDGKADKFTVVNDTLNIPIGILPLTDGAINFSIPNLYKFTDSNADDKFENSKILLGPFGYTDTHGMVSNFMRGYDGWVYACHGFTNASNVAGADGDTIKMVSGNTFRFRFDGGRVEQMTFGQVNPFGLAFDEHGYMYSTDSHSSPLYQLIRGGDYPHFGKIPIMAFGPDMKSFEKEATSLCGIAQYADTKFPKEFQGNFFIGDVVSSRVHRYSWEFKGSSPIGKSEIDFVKSEDPWFRPVNIKLGPDGALYIADFYNAIIGHYEAPLGHPKRDHERGRIWRITYKGEHNDVTDLTSASVKDLITTLDAENLPTRMTAADQLVDRIGNSAVEQVQRVLNETDASARKQVQSLWILHRLNAMTDEILKSSMAHSSPLIRLHTLRIVRERKSNPELYYPLVLNALNDNDAHVKRAAVELLMDFKEMKSVESVLSVLKNTPTTDTHLIYTSMLALRNLLRDNNLMKLSFAKDWSEEDAGHIAGVLVDVPSADAAIFLSNFISKKFIPNEKLQLSYQQIMRFIPANQIDDVITKAKSKDTDIDLKSLAYKGMKEGLAQRGGNVKSKLLEPWGKEIAEGLLAKYPARFKPTSDEVTARQNFALQLTADLKINSLLPSTNAFLDPTSNVNQDLKMNALRTALALSADNSAVELAGQLLSSDTTKLAMKKRIASMLGDFPRPSTNKVLASLKKSPPDLEVIVATALANSSEGKDIIFDQVRNGSFMLRTLIDPRVEERILLNISGKQQKEYEALTANIEPINKERQSLIDERVKSISEFRPTNFQLDSGETIFWSNCGACHRRLTESGIGPQLHGIGKRGVQALAEKIIDPNRNISEAFRNYTIKLKDGKILTGLYRREAGSVIVFGDLNGKEFSVAKKDIAEQKASRYTIMPDHFSTSLSEKEMKMLIAYLLTW
jgi:putative heme-binding domain-containing protein